MDILAYMLAKKNASGYYTPEVTRTDDTTLTFNFTPSQDSMTEVTAVNVTLPAGPQGKKGDTGAQGPKGDTGAPGAAGADGKTPVKGVDYWTDDDKAEMVADILDSFVNAGEVAL